MIRTLVIDDLAFHVRWSQRRRTIGITVGRDGELCVAAPLGCPRRLIEDAVRERLDWIRRKLAEQHVRTTEQTRTYRDGELFPYLGRPFPLRLVDGPDVAVRLCAGRFELDRSLTDDGRAQMAGWYMARARSWIPARLGILLVDGWPAPSTLAIRDIGKRWGTCNAKGKISVHWQAILLPPPIIDYILVHELMHLRELNHSKAFWAHVQAVLPDCGERRVWLRQHGHRHVL